MPIRPPGRAPREYDSAAVDRLIRGAYDVAQQAATSAERTAADLRSLRLTGDSRVSVASVQPYLNAEWLQINDGGNEYLEGRLFVFSGALGVASYEARHAEEGNISNEAWNDIASNWIDDTDYPGDGYYRYRVSVVTAKKGRQLVTMELRATAADGSAWFSQSHTFDYDREPELSNLQLYLGIYNPSTEQWPVYASVSGDEDVGSIAFYGNNAELDADPENLPAALFTDAIVNARVAQHELVGNYDIPPAGSEQAIYVAARPWAGANKTGTEGVQSTLWDSIDLPSKQSTDAGLLAQSAQRANINLDVTHNGLTPYNAIDIAAGGTIEYADGTTYTMAAHTLSLTSGTTRYAFFDPSGWVGEGTGTPASELQLTSVAATAHDVVGRRLFIGIIEATSAPEYAAWYFTSNEPAISKVFVYAAKLSALSADLGDITAGSLVITTGSNKMWLNDGDDGVLAIGGTTKGSAPFYVAADGSVTMTSATITGMITTYRQSAAPSTPETGDMWVDTDDGVWYRWNGASWDEVGSDNTAWRHPSDFTMIDGGDIYTNTVTATQINLTQLSDVTADAGTLTAGLLSLSGGSKFGDLALGAGSEGMQIGAGTNNWYVSGGNTYFNMGDATNYLHWDSLTGLLSMRVGSGTFFNIGNNVNGADTHGIKIDANNYWYVDTAPVTDVAYFAIGDGTQGMTFDTSSGNLVVTGSIIANGSTVIDYGTGNIQNANLTTLTITGTLTFGGGSITGAAGGYTSTLAAGLLTVEFGDILSTVQGDEFRLQHQTGAAGALLAFSGTTAGVDRRGYLSLSSDDAGSVAMDAAGITATASFALVATTGLTLTNSSGTYTWPTSAPAADGYILSSTTGGAMSWIEMGGGDVTKVGTPADNQIGVWTGDGTIEGDLALTFDTATDTLRMLAAAPSVNTANDSPVLRIEGITDVAAVQTSLGWKMWADLTDASENYLAYLSGITDGVVDSSLYYSSSTDTWNLTSKLAVTGSVTATGASTQLSVVYTGGSQFASMYADNNGRLQLYTSGGAFHPTTNAGQDLGTTSRKWGILYATDAYFGLGGSVTTAEIAGFEIDGGNGATGGSVVDMKLAGTSRYQIYASDGVLGNQTRMLSDWTWWGSGGGNALTLDISEAEFKFSKGIGITGGAAPTTAAGVMKLYADTEDLPKALIGTSGPVGIGITWATMYSRLTHASNGGTQYVFDSGTKRGTHTMPTAHFVAGQSYRVFASGENASNSGALTMTWSVRAGTTPIASKALTLNANATWVLDGMMVVSALSGTATLVFDGTLTWNDTVYTVSGSASGIASGGVDLDVALTWSGTDTDTIHTDIAVLGQPH